MYFIIFIFSIKKTSALNSRKNTICPFILRFYFFDKDWVRKKYNKSSLTVPEDITLPKPANYEKMIEDCVEKLEELYGENKIILPVDFVINKDAIMDVGPKTIDLFSKCCQKCEILFVNGTCGKYEDEKYAELQQQINKGNIIAAYDDDK